jgi:hypothetical protein
VNSNVAHAVKLIHATCCLAGSPSYLQDIRADLRRAGVIRAVMDHDAPTLFNWLVQALSFQGVSDAVASEYMATYGSVGWLDIATGLARAPCCPKLYAYSEFHGCRYRKASHTCGEPEHIGSCPLPRHPLRNGRLNQMAYGLFLFMRDVAGNDFVGWIDRQIDSVGPTGPHKLSTAAEAVLDPLRKVFGVADKVLAMALSFLMLGVGNRKPTWFAVGATFVTVDTLVHNFLHRTGILGRFSAEHPYGRRCYEPDGCATVIRLIAAEINAREFNRAFPSMFPGFVQSAIWRYCAGNGLDVCNGNRIDDRARCQHAHCQLFRHCDRVALPRQIAENVNNSVV